MPGSLGHGDLVTLVPLSEVLWVISFALTLIFLAHILKTKRPPQSTIAWILVIILLPYVGVPLYLIFGGRKLKRLAGSKRRVYPDEAEPSEFAFGAGTERILRTFGVPSATLGNRVKLLEDGQQAYQELLSLIDGAREYIHVTTYILGKDATGRDVVERLARKAASGVKVRLLIDDVGSWRLPRRAARPLIQAGGEVAYFMPVLHLPFRGRSNLRNHRKIAVADGVLALTGGMNLAGEYMGPGADLNRWVDMSLLVEGQAARELDRLFDSDWRFATDQEHRPTPADGELDEPKPEVPVLVPLGGTPVQVVASGPDVPGDPLYESLVNLIFTAQRRIWIATPYFVPDEILARALELAARRGLDVRLVVPMRSNHVTADLARFGYLRQVHDAGGVVLRYRPVMIHAKVIAIDDDIAVVGSANMDMRSLFLNYEVALYLFSAAKVHEIDGWFRGLFPHCKPGIGKSNAARELAENVVRLLSPLL